MLLDQKHPCTRTCVKGAAPMICRYRFTMEWYHTLSKACFSCPSIIEDCKRPHCIPGDGVKRSVLVVNRQMPGPSIDVSSTTKYLKFSYVILYLKCKWTFDLLVVSLNSGIRFVNTVNAVNVNIKVLLAN